MYIMGVLNKYFSFILYPRPISQTLTTAQGSYQEHFTAESNFQFPTKPCLFFRPKIKNKKNRTLQASSSCSYDHQLPSSYSYSKVKQLKKQITKWAIIIWIQIYSIIICQTNKEGHFLDGCIKLNFLERENDGKKFNYLLPENKKVFGNSVPLFPPFLIRTRIRPKLLA